MFRASNLILLALLLASCAQTDISSYVDPAFRSVQRFASVAVFASGADLEERGIIENAVVEKFALNRVRALRGVDIVPPTRNYTTQGAADAIRATGVETVLFIVVGDKDVSETYVPPTYHPGTAYGSAYTFGNTTYLTLNQTPGYTTGGYSIAKPLAAYSATLISIDQGAVVWKADATSRGTAFNSFDDLSRSVAVETVNRLVADKIF